MVGHSKKRRSAIGGVAGKAGSARYGPLFSKPKRPRSEGAPVLDNNNNNHSLDSMSQDSASREIVFDFTSIPLTHAKKSGNFNAGEPVTFGQNNINNNVKSLGNMFNFSQSQNGVSSQSPSKSSELPFPGILSCSPGNNYASVNTPFHLNSLSHLNISAEDSVLCTPQDQPVHSQNDRKLDLDLQNRRNSKNVHTSSPLKLEILPAIQNPFILSSENETDRIANVPEGGPLTQVQGFGRYMSEFVPLERLGGGDFGEVRKCRRKLDGCYYALKRITSTFRGSKELKFQLNEVHALSALKTFPYDGSSNNHGPDELMFFYGLGHIIQYFDSWIEGNQLYILTELCEAGDLYKLYINGSGEDRNSLDINRLLRRLLSQIGAALAVIHYLGLSHLDLKPGNILQKKRGIFDFRLSDFGQSCSLHRPSSGAQVSGGDARYLAPEMLTSSNPDLSKVDVFALGISALEIAVGSNFTKDSIERAGECLKEASVSPDISALILLMINLDPSERPKSLEIARYLQVEGYMQVLSSEVGNISRSPKLPCSQLSKLEL